MYMEASGFRPGSRDSYVMSCFQVFFLRRYMEARATWYGGPGGAGPDGMSIYSGREVQFDPKLTPG